MLHALRDVLDGLLPIDHFVHSRARLRKQAFTEESQISTIVDHQHMTVQCLLWPANLVIRQLSIGGLCILTPSMLPVDTINVNTLPDPN